MLSNTAEYALRAMIHLARVHEGEALLGRELSDRSGVPANYLSKILLLLKRSNLVSAVRGAGGGYRLARPAGEILLVEVLEIFDPVRAHPRCLLDIGHACSDEQACSAHHKWRSVRREYIDFIATTTLAEIAEGATSPGRLA
jgi:Rrf2 family protein